MTRSPAGDKDCEGDETVKSIRNSIVSFWRALDTLEERIYLNMVLIYVKNGMKTQELLSLNKMKWHKYKKIKMFYYTRNFFKIK